MPERVTSQNMIRVPVAVGAMLLAGVGTAAGDLIESQHVGIGTVVAVCGVVGSCAWWIGGKLTRIELGQEEAREHFRKLDKTLESLPCRNGNSHNGCKPPEPPSDTTT